LLLQIAFAQVLELSLAEFEIGRTGHGQLVAVALNDHVARGQLSRLSANLDLVLQVLFELCHVENLVGDGLCAVNDELDGRFLCFGCLWKKSRRATGGKVILVKSQSFSKWEVAAVQVKGKFQRPPVRLAAVKQQDAAG